MRAFFSDLKILCENNWPGSYFLKGVIKFKDITTLNETNLEKIFAKNSNIMNPSLNDIKNINNWTDNNLFLGLN